MKITTTVKPSGLPVEVLSDRSSGVEPPYRATYVRTPKCPHQWEFHSVVDGEHMYECTQCGDIE